MEGTKNKYFWQCAKCEYIHKNKISATQCFDMHSQLIKLQTNNPNRQIGNRVTYTTTGRFPNRYEAIITNIVNKNTIEVCPVKRIDLK